MAFRLSGAGKSVFKLVGTNYEDGQIVLLVVRLFGFLVRESRCFSWLGPTMRMDKSCCWKGGFSALLRGKVGVLVGACGRAVVCAPFVHVDP